jgi:hypothetical protein
MQELDELILNFNPKIELVFARSDVQSFILENGAAQLEQWFTDVTTYHYDDALIITEAEPLVDYVLSTITFTDDQLIDFTQYVEQKLAHTGSIYVTKASGFFGATRKDAR